MLYANSTLLYLHLCNMIYHSLRVFPYWSNFYRANESAILNSTESQGRKNSLLMLASHAKDLILRTKLIYVKHLSASYFNFFMWSALHFFYILFSDVTGYTQISESIYASSRRILGTFHQFLLFTCSGTT